MRTNPACLPRRAVTSIARSTLHWLEWLFWKAVFLVGTSGPDRNGRSSGFQENPPLQNVKHQPKAPLPRRVGGRVYIDTPTGEVELTPLEVSIHAQAWLDVVAGGFVYERTKLPGRD